MPRRCVCARLRTLAGFVLCLCAGTSEALASGPAVTKGDSATWGVGRVEVGLAPVYAYVVLDRDGQPKGGGGAIYVNVGLTKTLAACLSGMWTFHGIAATKDSPSDTLSVLALAAGFAYTVDLERYAPKVELGIGLLRRRLAGETQADLGILIGLALDYRLREWLSVGAAFHYHAPVADLATLPLLVDLGPRLTLRWP